MDFRLAGVAQLIAFSLPVVNHRFYRQAANRWLGKMTKNPLVTKESLQASHARSFQIRHRLGIGLQIVLSAIIVIASRYFRLPSIPSLTASALFFLNGIYSLSYCHKALVDKGDIDVQTDAELQLKKKTNDAEVQRLIVTGKLHDAYTHIDQRDPLFNKKVELLTDVATQAFAHKEYKLSLLAWVRVPSNVNRFIAFTEAGHYEIIKSWIQDNHGKQESKPIFTEWLKPFLKALLKDEKYDKANEIMDITGHDERIDRIIRERKQLDPLLANPKLDEIILHIPKDQELEDCSSFWFICRRLLHQRQFTLLQNILLRIHEENTQFRLSWIGNLIQSCANLLKEKGLQNEAVALLDFFAQKEIIEKRFAVKWKRPAS